MRIRERVIAADFEIAQVVARMSFLEGLRKATEDGEIGIIAKEDVELLGLFYERARVFLAVVARVPSSVMLDTVADKVVELRLVMRHIDWLSEKRLKGHRGRDYMIDGHGVWGVVAATRLTREIARGVAEGYEREAMERAREKTSSCDGESKSDSLDDDGEPKA